MKSTVETKIIELVKSGHELAKELHCAESAALVSDLASQLEVQLVRSNALAAKLSMINDLMDAAEQANKLAQEATEKLVQERDALAAENAGLKDFVKTCFRAAADGASLDGADIQELGERLGLFGRETYQPALHGYICGHEAGEDTVYVMKKTPATDALLAEVRASALDEFARAQDEQAKKYYELSPGCSAQNECQFAAGQAWYFAECIRKGAAQ